MDGTENLPNKTCIVPNCNNPPRKRNIECSHHALLRFKYGSYEERVRTYVKDKICAVEECGQPCMARQWCSVHYDRWVRHKELGPVGRINAKAGSGYKLPTGYRAITKMGHPNAHKRNGRIYEHTYVMSQILGRPLEKGEVVHHKNGIRDDNRPENLELKTAHHPAGQSITDMLDFCEWYLNKYESVSLSLKPVEEIQEI